MAEKRKAQSGPDSPRRSRPAPTLDLTATEIPPEATPTEAPAVAETVEPALPVEPPVETATPEPAAADVPPPEPPPIDEPPPATDLPPQPERPPPRERGIGVPLFAGFVGGIIPSAILAGLWYGGVLPGSRTPDLQPRFTQIEQQIAGVKSDLQAQQNQSKALAARVAVSPSTSPSIDPKAVDALGDRVAKLEAAVKDLSSKPAVPVSADPQLQSRIGTIEGAMKSNDTALATLKQQTEQARAASGQAQHQFEVTSTAVTQLAARVDDLAKQRPDGVTPAQYEALQKQVALLEQATQAVSKGIAQNTAAASASRVALAAATLRSAVVSGAPYEAELKQAQALGADAKQLAPLQRFAASGVPSDAKLAEQLRALLPSLTQSAAPAQASGSFIDRLRENAGRLVRVTPANAPAGDEPSNVLMRLSLDADHADIAAAMTDIQKLPPEAQQKAADWIALVKARNETLAAARTFASNAAQSLGTR